MKNALAIMKFLLFAEENFLNIVGYTKKDSCILEILEVWLLCKINFIKLKVFLDNMPI